MSRHQAMRSVRKPSGFVYVVSATNGYVKIGAAGDPFSRFTTHQCSSPLVLVLSYVCKCDVPPVDIEEAAHELLAEHRRHREWFEVSPARAIAALREVLCAAGLRTEPVPHRTQNPRGAPLILAPAEINEVAVPR